VKPLVLSLTFLVCAAHEARTQEAIYLVRHAERADSSADAKLSAEGEARAVRLAQWLKTANITHIYTTDLKRTIQTAMPFAAASRIAPQQSPAADTYAIVGRVHGLGAHDRALVVGHSNTIPELIRHFGVATPVVIGDNEYDNIFVVVPRKDAEPVLLRFKY